MNNQIKLSQLAALLIMSVFSYQPNNGIAGEIGVTNTYLDSNIGVVVDEDKDETFAAFKIGAGFEIDNFMSFGFSAIKTGDESDNRSVAEVYTTLMRPLGDKSKVYVKGSVNTFDKPFNLGFGFFYPLSKHIELTVGYDYYNELGYSFVIGGKYLFGSVGNKDKSKEYEFKSNVKKDTLKEFEESTPTINDSIIDNEKNIKDRATDSSCKNRGAEIVPYTVKSGDWLLKIARENCNTFEEIIELNVFVTSRVDQIYPKETIRLYK